MSIIMPRGRRTNTENIKEIEEQPSKRLRRLSTGKTRTFNNSSSAAVLSHDPVTSTPQGRYSMELIHLQENWRPKALGFRDEEKSIISLFIEEGIARKGLSSALYVTGLPGLGKTAAIVEVIDQLIQKNIAFNFIYINSLKLSSPIGFYSKLWLELTGVDENTTTACRYLDLYFRAKSLPSRATVLPSRTQTKLLVIDEIDFLRNKKQDVLYNIFEWMQYPSANLIIICVANTLNFQSVLLPKIQSRMGKKVLIFKPYSSEEIKAILVDRLGKSILFREETLTFIAKKVASFSSDIRKSLAIARQSVIQFKSNTNGKNQIDIEFVSQIFEKEGLKPIVQFIKGTSDGFKIFLISLLSEVKFRNTSFFDLDDLFERTNDLLIQSGRNKISFGELSLLIERSIDLKILKNVGSVNNRVRLELIVDADELSFSLKNDQVFCDFGHLRSVYESN